MLCFLCGKKIGFVRGLMDQQYCSTKHRQEARLASAQALRDEEDHEPWSVSKSKERKPLGRTAPSAGQAASIFAFLTVAALLVAALLLPGPGPGAAFPKVSLDPGVKRGLLARTGDWVGDVVRSSAPVTMNQTFRGSGGLTSAAANLADWATVNLRAGTTQMDDPRDWIGKPKSIPSLRLWKKTTTMQNYQMEFQAELQQTSLSWAVRATDGGNHYGTKLVMSKPGPLPNADLVHYTMFNGKEYDRVQSPVGVTLARGKDYRMRVAVQGNRFMTYLNGNLIGSWTDNRLPRGGVGFFQQEDDPQKVEWVSLSERDSFLGRLLGHFAMFVVPE